MTETLAHELALLVALTSMDVERRTEFHALIARVRRLEMENEAHHIAFPVETVVYVDFRRE